MKIGIATSGDFISNFIINEIYKKFPDDEFAIIIDENVGKTDTDFSKDTVLIEHIIPEKFIYPLIESLNINSKYLTYNQLNNKQNISLYRLININKHEKLIKSLNLDVLISVKFRTIFKENIIKLPKFGIFNVHSGVLPTYRGAYALLYAMNNGEKKFGCTIHRVSDNTIDTGNIFDMKLISINKKESYVKNYINMFSALTPSIIKLLYSLKNDKKMKFIKQNEKKSNYYTFPTEKDTNDFFLKKYTVFNNSDIIEIIKHYI